MKRRWLSLLLFLSFIVFFLNVLIASQTDSANDAAILLERPSTGDREVERQSLLALPAPGGVDTDLQLWMRADSGVTEVNGNDVTEWLDLTGQHTPTFYNSDPDLVEDSLNFNPVVTFDGDDFLRWDSDPFVTAFTAGDVFVVTKENVASNAANPHPFDFGGSGGSWYTFNDGQVYEDFGISGGDGQRLAFLPSVATDKWRLYNVASQTDDVRAYLDGHLEASKTTNTPDFSLASAPHLGARHGGIYQGDIAEVILYNRVLSTSEREQVASYFALKYALTLQHDYLDSSGTTIWDATANATYHNDVAAIGVDDDSALSQLTSRSVNQDSIVTIAGTGIADGSFLIWGNNDSSFAGDTSDKPAGYEARLNRVWKVAQTGNVGNVSVTFELQPYIYNSGDLSDYALLIHDADSGFASATVHTTGESLSDGQITFTDVSFNDGDFFTLGIPHLSPGQSNGEPALVFAIENSGLIDVWHSNGDGTFDSVNIRTNATIVNFGTANEEASFMADVTGDGESDLIYVSNHNDYIDVWSGNGDGTFAATAIRTNATIADFGESGVEESFLEDVTADGVLDLVFAIEGGGAFIDVLSGNGDGTFATTAIRTTPTIDNIGISNEEGSFLADVTEDDVPDLVFATNPGDYIDVWSGNGDGTFATTAIRTNATIADFGQSGVEASFLADVTADGVPDFVFAIEGGGAFIDVWSGNGDGTFATTAIRTTPTIDNIGISNEEGSFLADVTEDDVPDLVFATNPGDYIDVWSGNGDGTFATTASRTNASINDFGQSDVEGSFLGFVTQGTISKSDAPGGVGTDLQLWMSADSGVTEVNGNDVTQWLDLTGRHTPSWYNSDPDLQENSLNFNPVVSFDGDDFLRWDSDPFVTGFSAGDVFVVTKENRASNLENGHPFDFGGSGIPWYTYSNGQIYEDFGISGGEGQRLVFAPSAPTQNWQLYNVASQTDDVRAYSNGNLEASKTTNTPNFSLASWPHLGARHDGIYQGDIAEVILYNRVLSTTERAQVASYLTLKYGLTLQHDYLDSSGTTIWDATANATYQNDVAGIGVDGVLSQLTSRSANDDSLVTITGTVATISDGEFLVWGNDDGALTASTEVPAGYTERLTRSWLVQETGDVGTIDITFDLTAITETINYSDTAGFALLIDADGDFSSNATATTGATVSDTQVTFTGIDFSDGQYFALAYPISTTLNIGPGGIADNLQLWLKADAGITESSGEVSQWDDQSGNGHSFVEDGAIGLPLYETNNFNFNFNPSLDFVNGDVRRLRDNSVGDLTDPATPTTFSVFIATIREGTGQAYFSYKNTGGNQYQLQMSVGGINGCAIEYQEGVLPPDNEAMLLGVTYDGTPANRRGYFNGLASVDSTCSTMGGSSTNGSAMVGAGPTANFNGHIAEVIVYDAMLTPLDAQLVHSYLALKYGITLEQSTAQDYYASDGSVIYAATTTLDNYDNNIAGIGRDDDSGLSQIKSSSINTDTLVTMEQGSGFANDLEFVVWGHDGANLTASTSGVPADVSEWLERQWAVQETGSTDAITVSVASTALISLTTSGELALIVADDAAFTSNVQTHLLSTNGANEEVSVTFDGTKYFTFGRLSPSGPGGIADNLQLWLKADTGISESSGEVSQWDDQSGNGHTFVQDGVIGLPLYETNNLGFNFNPSLDFVNGDVRRLRDNSVGDLTDPATPTTFSVFIATIREGTGQAYFSYKNTGGNQYQLQMSVGGLNGCAIEYQEGVLPPDNEAMLLGLTYDGTPANRRGYFNGLATVDSTCSTMGGSGTNGSAMVGAGPTANFNGHISEIIVYDAMLSPVDAQLVQSYLALKYGITLEQSTAQDYYASDGSVIYPATTSHDSYDHDIAGIGRDDGSTLAQLKSKSINSDAIVTMANGNDMASPSPFALDNAFLIWGNDGITLTNVVEETVNGTSYNRLERLWRVQETGTVTDMVVSFDFSGLSVTWEETQVALLIDSDIDFSDATLHTTGRTVNGDEISFSNVDFSSGDTFTLILEESQASNQAPTEITLSNATIAENEPISTTVGTFSTADGDVGDTHTYALVAGAGDEDNASFTIDGDTLKTNESFDIESQNSYQIRVQSTDSGSLTVSSAFTITVTNVDEPPTVANPLDDVTVDEDADDTTIDLTNVFSDTDNDDALISKEVLSNSNSSLVAATLSGNTLVLDYQADQHGSATITVRGTSGGLTVDDTFTVTVNAVDDAPVVVNPLDDVTVDEDASNTTIDLTSVFTDIDNDDALISKTVQTNTNPSLVVATISGDTLTLAYQADQHGSALIGIRATSNGQTVDDSFMVVVNAVDDSLIVINPIPDVTVDEEAPDTLLDLSNVFTDLDNDDALIIKTVQNNSNPDLVEATIVSNTLTLAYQADQEGTATITIRATSGDSVTDDTFLVTVNPVDDAPVVLNPILDVTVDEDASDTTIDLPAVFTDIDDDDALISKEVLANSDPELVQATIAGETLTLAYQADQHGSATLTIRATSNGQTVDDEFTVTLNGVDDAPIVANPITDLTADEDASDSEIDLSNVFTDLDDDDALITKEIFANSNTDLVQATISGNTLTLAYQATQNGSATITIRATSNDQTVDDTFIVTVNPVDNPPTVANPILDVTVDEDASDTTIDLSDVFTDIDNDDALISKEVHVNSDPSLVVATIAGDTLLLDYQADQHGSATLTIRATSNGQTVDDEFTVTVNAVNDAPLAEDDSVQSEHNTTLTIDVLANDSDIENDSLTISAFIQPTNGTVSLNLDNTLQYTPTMDFDGEDSFTYTVVDGNGGSTQATVTVTVLPANLPPVANDDSANTELDTPVLINVVANDTDPHNDTLTLQSITQPANGSALIVDEERVNYTPQSGFSGVDTFTYTIEDGRGGSASATVIVNINTSSNNPPIASDDSAATNEEMLVSIHVLGNDSDPDNDPLTVQSITQPPHGTASLNMNGGIDYTPQNNFAGSDSFTYAVTDGQGSSDEATVTIEVIGINDPPVANQDIAITIYNNPVVIDILSNDSHPDGDPFTISTLTTPLSGTADLNDDGTVTYTLLEGMWNEYEWGLDSFEYTINDPDGESATATVLVNLNPNSPSDWPIARPDSGATTPGVAIDLDVLFNDDYCGDFCSSNFDDLLSIQGVTQGTAGSVSLNDDGTVHYVPNADFLGVDSFTYFVTNGTSGSAEGTVTVEVAPLPPVTNLTAIQVGVYPIEIRLDWSYSQLDGIDGFEIVSPDGSIIQQQDNSYLDASEVLTYSLPFGNDDIGTYTYTVRAFVGDLSSAYANVQVTIEREPFNYQTGSGVIEGTVQTGDGELVADAKVCAFWYGQTDPNAFVCHFTDSSGAFSFDNLDQEAVWEVHATPPNSGAYVNYMESERLDVNLFVEGGQYQLPAPLVLNRPNLEARFVLADLPSQNWGGLRGGGRHFGISGVLKEASVRIKPLNQNGEIDWGATGWETMTNREGELLVGTIPAGDYALWLEELPAAYQDYLLPEPIPFTIQSSGNITNLGDLVVLKATKQITGIVTYPDGRRVPNGLIEANRALADGTSDTKVVPTDENGYYTLLVSDGIWEIKPILPDGENTDWLFISVPEQLAFQEAPNIPETAAANFVVAEITTFISGQVMISDEFGQVGPPFDESPFIGPMGRTDAGIDLVDIEHNLAYSVYLARDGSFQVPVLPNSLPQLSLWVNDRYIDRFGFGSLELLRWIAPELGTIPVANNNVDLGSLVLISPLKEFYGEVTDEEGRERPYGNTVNAWNYQNNWFNADSDDDNYEFKVVAGTWTVGPILDNDANYIFEGQNAQITFSEPDNEYESESVDFILTTATLRTSGRFVDQNGQVINLPANAYLTRPNSNEQLVSTPAADGQFELPWPNDCPDCEVHVVLGDGATYSLLDANVKPVAEQVDFLVAQNNSTLSGYLLSPQTGEVVTDTVGYATLIPEGSSTSAHTTPILADGSYHFEGLGSGNYTLNYELTLPNATPDILIIKPELALAKLTYLPSATFGHPITIETANEVLAHDIVLELGDSFRVLVEESPNQVDINYYPTQVTCQYDNGQLSTRSCLQAGDAAANRWLSACIMPQPTTALTPNPSPPGRGGLPAQLRGDGGEVPTAQSCTVNAAASMMAPDFMPPAGQAVAFATDDLLLQARARNFPISGQVLAPDGQPASDADVNITIFTAGTDGQLELVQPNETGNYNVIMSQTDATWTIRADAALDGFYHTVEIVITNPVPNSQGILEVPTLTLASTGQPVIPPSSQGVDENGGVGGGSGSGSSGRLPLSLGERGLGGEGVQVQIPANALPDGTNANFSISVVFAPSHGQKRVVGNAYNLQFVDAATARPIQSLRQEIAVELPYNLAQLEEMGISANQLSAAFFVNNLWTPIQSKVDESNQVIKLKLDRLPDAVAIVAPGEGVYEPTVPGIFYIPTEGVQNLSLAEGITISIASDTFRNMTTLEYRSHSAIATGDLLDVDLFYSLVATDSTGIETAPNPLNPYTITVTYDATLIPASMHNKLALYHQNEVGVWEKEPTSTINLSNHIIPGRGTITAHPTRFGMWALLREKPMLYLPLIGK